MEKVERTQYHVALSITGTWQGTSRYKLTKSWDGSHCLTVVGAGAFSRYKKNEKYITPSYLRDKLPPHHRHLYRFNNSNTFQKISCKTCRYQNSFFPDATSSWNNMISNFKDIPTYTSLKSHLSFFNSSKDQKHFWYT